MPQLITIVHMGDSITFSQHMDSPHKWTNLVQARFEDQFCETDVHVQCLNRGVSGETTRMGLERFPRDVQSAHPQIVTLQFGMNDCNCWLSDRGLPRVSESAFRSNLVEMIERIRRFECHEIILSTNPVSLRTRIMLSGKSFEAANARYTEIIREVARHTGVVLCDVREAFEKLNRFELAEMLLPHPDNLHLSIKGNQFYTDIVFPFVERALDRIMNKACAEVSEPTARLAG